MNFKGLEKKLRHLFRIGKVEEKNLECEPPASLKTRGTPRKAFLVRVTGNSMQDVGIHDGGILVVDKSAEIAHGKIVIASVYGEFTVKTLKMRGDKTCLVPANGDYQELELTPEMDAEVWGIVTGVVRKLP